MSADRAVAPLAVSRAALAARQPPERVVPDALKRIRTGNDAAARHVVILDDDPTGSQVVHDIPVLTRWEDADLHWAFSHPARTFFILTNTRSLDAPSTAGLLRDLDSRLRRIATHRGAEFVVISRSDSTLRGHFPLETDVLQEMAGDRGTPYDAVLLVPAYVDASRVTVGDVHYAGAGENYVPVGETDYANDEAFGYSTSVLTDWVEEKTAGAISAQDVVSLSLEDIRSGGISRVSSILAGVHNGAVVVVNALVEADLEVVVLALLEAESQGWRAICRVGPSFVPVRIGMDRKPVLTTSEIFAGRESAGQGLVVVGSYVDLTTRQLTALLELPGTTMVELDVDALLDPSTERTAIDRAYEQVTRAAAVSDVVLATSRRLVVVSSGESSLDLSRQVSAALVEITRRAAAEVRFAWVIAKGGITSHDIATDALGIRRAMVLGQLFPGTVSVWRNETVDDEDRPNASPGLPLVVFPGNVGDDTTLRDAVQRLRHSYPLSLQ